MIRARVEDGKRSLLLLGIVEGNVDRLRQGHPIYVDLEELGLPNTDLAIWLGADHAQLLRVLERVGVRLPPGSYDQAKEADQP